METQCFVWSIRYPLKSCRKSTRSLQNTRKNTDPLSLPSKRVRISVDICQGKFKDESPKGLSLSPSQVYGVVSFYAFFTTTPRGKHIIRVCLGTACYVKGSKQIIEKLEQELHLKVGGITKDRKFSLEAVRCLGCCSLAPAMVVDNDTHALVDPSEAVRIVRSYE